MPFSCPPTIGFVTCAAYRHLTTDDLILAAALERRGSRVVPVVWTETQPGQLGCDLLILRSVWDYHFHPEAFFHWVHEAHQRAPVVNPPDIVRWNMDKHYLLDLEAAGFAVPKTFVLEQGASADLDKVMDVAGLAEVVIKPAISASAFETHRLHKEDGAQFNKKVNELLQARAMLLQEFVGEIETGGEWSLVFLGGEFSHAVHKLPREGDFRVQHEFGGTHRAAEPPAPLLQASSDILARFAPKAAYCRADMVLREQGPTLMELELIEPLLHFELVPRAAEWLAGRLCREEF